MNSTNNVAAPQALTGIVTTIVLTLSGGQTGAIDTHGVGTDYARLVLRWGKLHMSFTNAEQVKNLRGMFAMARQGMLGAETLATLPVAEADPTESATVAAITWAKTPTGSASIEQLHVPRLRRTIRYVAFTVGNVTFWILDHAALDSVLELLARAHTLAEATFPDGPAHRTNPTTSRWRPDVEFERHGNGWIPRR